MFTTYSGYVCASNPRINYRRTLVHFRIISRQCKRLDLMFIREVATSLKSKAPGFESRLKGKFFSLLHETKRPLGTLVVKSQLQSQHISQCSRRGTVCLPSKPPKHLYLAAPNFLPKRIQRLTHCWRQPQ